MATITSVDEIIAWQKARDLANRIYLLTKDGDFSKDFKLKDQINGAAGSIMDNIAEGFERNGSGEFIQFLAIAKGSAGEVKSQLARAVDRGYVTAKNFEDLSLATAEVSNLIGGFMSYLIQCGHKGNKFKSRIKKSGPSPNN